MSLTQISSRLIHITARDAASLQDSLDTAVDLLIGTASKQREQGIVLTRHSHSFYSAELSNDVPYGEIHEIGV